MSATPDGDAIGFMILSDADFERLSLEERVAYMKTAVTAVQRLQKQIQVIVEQVGKKLQP
jgi:tripartite-type tricarboxylate transporter receptor subunit TctC